MSGALKFDGFVEAEVAGAWASFPFEQADRMKMIPAIRM
jgi:hypothetical protein